MKSTATPTFDMSVEIPTPVVEVRPRLADYVQLTKPRIAVMSLITVGLGYLAGAGPFVSWVVLAHTLIGTALVAAGAAALNHWMERDLDGRMKRTANRPLPSGRLRPADVFLFGCSLGIAGMAYLVLLGPNMWPAVLAGLTLLLYVCVYTPLKQLTTTNTLIGAVPGALPPLIGWTAATGSITAGGVALFLILFLWQLPHFFAIAWMYREEYARAGLRMLPVVDPDGGLTSRSTVMFTLALIMAGLLPVALGMAGPIYLAGSLVLGVMFLVSGLRFWRDRTTQSARKVLLASLVYLPAVMALLVIGR